MYNVYTVSQIRKAAIFLLITFAN